MKAKTIILSIAIALLAFMTTNAFAVTSSGPVVLAHSGGATVNAAEIARLQRAVTQAQRNLETAQRALETARSELLPFPSSQTLKGRSLQQNFTTAQSNEAAAKTALNKAQADLRNAQEQRPN